LHDVASEANQTVEWITLENVAQSSPAARLIDAWVEDLAINQVLVFRDQYSATVLNFQSDGGQLKQEVSVLSTFDQKKDVVKQEYAGLTSVGGKKAIDIALVAQQRLNLFRERQPPLYPPPSSD